MTNQLTNALMQPAHHLSHRQHQLDRRISIRSHLFQPLHGSQRFDLIRFLHSDSPFFRQRKIALSLSKGQSLRVATFYDLPGIPGAAAGRSVGGWGKNKLVAEKGVLCEVTYSEDEGRVGAPQLCSVHTPGLLAGDPAFSATRRQAPHGTRSR